jgi:hypothetical protein
MSRSSAEATDLDRNGASISESVAASAGSSASTDAATPA